jgi:hypothetical protein
MIQLVVGAAAGYVLGTKAGRRRFEQIRGAYETAVNSPVTRRAVRAGRKALADRLDPEPRMREVRDLRRGDATGSNALLENDDLEFDEDRIISTDDPVMRDTKGRPARDQDTSGRATGRRRR